MTDIIVVTYNADRLFYECIDEVIKNTDGDYLLTVVNNNDDMRIADQLKGCLGNKVQLINAGANKGFSGGANLGIKGTSGDMLVFLDDDAVVTYGWLAGITECFDFADNVGIVGAKILYPDGRIFCADYRIMDHMPLGTNEKDKGQRDYIKECDAVAGTCWIMKRELVDNIGYFDEGYFPSQYEDIDYCIRARLGGYRIVYNGRVSIIHHHLFRSGRKGQNMDNFKRFSDKWDSAISGFPLDSSSDADKHMAYSVKARQNGEYDKAYDEFTKAVSYGNIFFEPVYEGDILAGMGEYEKAVNRYNEALKYDPDNVMAFHGLALVFKKMNMADKAREYAVKAMKGSIPSGKE